MVNNEQTIIDGFAKQIGGITGKKVWDDLYMHTASDPYDYNLTPTSITETAGTTSWKKILYYLAANLPYHSTFDIFDLKDDTTLGMHYYGAVGIVTCLQNADMSVYYEITISV